MHRTSETFLSSSVAVLQPKFLPLLVSSSSNPWTTTTEKPHTKLHQTLKASIAWVDRSAGPFFIDSTRTLFNGCLNQLKNGHIWETWFNFPKRLCICFNSTFSESITSAFDCWVETLFLSEAPNSDPLCHSWFQENSQILSSGKLCQNLNMAP